MKQVLVSTVFFIGSLTYVSTLSLHDWCLSQTIHSSYPWLHKFALTFVQSCENATFYRKCMTSLDQLPPKVSLSKAENKYFPDANNTERAVLMMCPYLFDKVTRDFPVSNTYSVSCGGAILDDTKDCNGSFNKDLIGHLEKALEDKDEALVKQHSCKLLAEKYNCLKKKVTALCGKEFEHIYNFHLARLGGECLAQEQIYVPLVTYVDCAPGKACSTRTSGILLAGLVVIGISAQKSFPGASCKI